jgi:hypothetical protein
MVFGPKNQVAMQAKWQLDKHFARKISPLYNKGINALYTYTGNHIIAGS